MKWLVILLSLSVSTLLHSHERNVDREVLRGTVLMVERTVDASFVGMEEPVILYMFKLADENLLYDTAQQSEKGLTESSTL